MQSFMLVLSFLNGIFFLIRVYAMMTIDVNEVTWVHYLFFFINPLAMLFGGYVALTMGL